jgi:diguanylate cyclase
MSKDNLDGWKQKYFSALEALEAKERLFSEVESLMRLAISRLSLVGEGQDPGLDRQLAAVRTAARGNYSSEQIARQIEDISETVKRLDARGDSTRRLVSDIARSLVALIDGIGFPQESRRVVAELRKSIRAASDPKQLTDNISRLAELISAGGRKAHQPESVVVNLDASPQADAPKDEIAATGFVLATEVVAAIADCFQMNPSLTPVLNSFRVRLREADNAPTLRGLATELAAIIGSAQSSGVAPNATSGTRAEISSTKVHTHEILVQLLDNIAFPAELSDQAELIKDRLEQGIDQNQWPSMLNTIAELIAVMRARVEAEKSELESFLRQLTERLKELDQDLQGAESERKASYVRGQKLGDVVDEQMNGLEMGVHQANTVTDVKLVIQERLDRIRSHLEEHRRAEESLQAQMEGQLRKAASRLQELETETGRLRANLHARQLQATMDPLTNIPNRLAHDERMKKDYARWKRHHTPLCLMVVDVDRFKHINDTYGHKAGDKALKLIAFVLKQTLRETDFIARYGGEEFVVLISDTPYDAVMTVAEKMRRAIEATEFHHSGQRVPVSISLGLATFAGRDTPEDVFQRADQALYRAKTAGRNRCVADPAPGNS